MHCFISAALTSAINTASVLLTIPFVLCSALYFAKCAQAWAFHSLQVGKSLHLHGEKKTIKTLPAASFLCSLAYPGLNALITLHSPPYSVDQRRDKRRWCCPGRALIGGLLHLPFNRCLGRSYRESFLLTVKNAYVASTLKRWYPVVRTQPLLMDSEVQEIERDQTWSCKHVPIQNPGHVPVQTSRLGKLMPEHILFLV